MSLLKYESVKVFEEGEMVTRRKGAGPEGVVLKYLGIPQCSFSGRFIYRSCCKNHCRTEVSLLCVVFVFSLVMFLHKRADFISVWWLKWCRSHILHL